MCIPRYFRNDGEILLEIVLNQTNNVVTSLFDSFGRQCGMQFYDENFKEVLLISSEIVISTLTLIVFIWIEKT